MKSLAILGSTGSVGKSTLDVIRENKDEFKIELLTARTNSLLMAEQCKEFTPKFVYLENNEAQKSFLDELGTNNPQVTLLSDEKELNQIIASQDLEIVVAAMVGIVGLKPVFQAIKHGKHILLANKESYVVAGEILNNLSKKTGATIFPIDSEHSAIHQCLMGAKNKESISRLILTGSCGPFLNRDINDFKNITPKEATAHPVWNMGDKISVDSSTMMNKIFEIVETSYMFDIDFQDIDVLIHRESIVHSMVEFMDGSVKAQLSKPDMKLPIQYAIDYPNFNLDYKNKIDFSKLSNLTFSPVDRSQYPCYDFSLDYILRGNLYISALSILNEILVNLFIEEKISYISIPIYLEKFLYNEKFDQKFTLDNIIEVRDYLKNKVSEEIKIL